MFQIIKKLTISSMLFNYCFLGSVYHIENSAKPCHPWCEIDEDGKLVHHENLPSLYKYGPKDY